MRVVDGWVGVGSTSASDNVFKPLLEKIHEMLLVWMIDLLN